MFKRSKGPSCLSSSSTHPDYQQHQPQPYKDALDLVNHQRLPVLFCSYYSNPKSTSTFCVQSLLNMTFYGNYDIMLGKFLMQYCFRRSYMCESCKMPMLEHIRRYVHSMGCVQVTITEDQTNQQQSGASAEQILMTSWCTICQVWTPSVPISKDTWCMSFAKYLEHRFHSHAYRRRIVDMRVDNNQHQNTNAMHAFEVELSKRQCPHSMHKDHVQHFSYNGIVVSFVYSIVEPFEITLPAPALLLQTGGGSSGGDETRTEEIKMFAQMGYEVFAGIYDKLAAVCGDAVEYPMLSSLKQTLNADQLAFRERVGAAQTLLTERPINRNEIADAMLLMRKLLADHIDQWNVRLAEAVTQARNLYSTSSTATVKAPPELPPVDAGTICTEDLRADSPPNAGEDAVELTDVLRRDDSASNNKISESSGDSSPIKCEMISLTATPIMKDADKKSVKTLLRELLPSDKHSSVHHSCQLQSPMPASEHLTLTVGQIPVLVHDQDLSSVIAYSLMSNEYKRELENMLLMSLDKETSGGGGGGSSATPVLHQGMAPNFSTPSPSVHRKSNDATTGSNNGDGGGTTGADDGTSLSVPSGKDVPDKKIKSNHIEVNFQVSVSNKNKFYKVQYDNKTIKLTFHHSFDYFPRVFDHIFDKTLATLKH